MSKTVGPGGLRVKNRPAGWVEPVRGRSRLARRPSPITGPELRRRHRLRPASRTGEAAVPSHKRSAAGLKDKIMPPGRAKARDRGSGPSIGGGPIIRVGRDFNTNVQEAADIVGLARGRDRKVGVGHQYRLLPSLVEARRRLAAGAIGPIRLVTASLAGPGSPRTAGRGLVAVRPQGGRRGHPGRRRRPSARRPALDHRPAAVEVAAFQESPRVGARPGDRRRGPALADGAPATVALSGVSPGALFELTYFGDRGRLRVTDRALGEESDDAAARSPCPRPTEEHRRELRGGRRRRGAPCAARPTRRSTRSDSLEAITRSAATGQVVRLA